MLEKITKFFKSKPEDYYCQYCGENLTPVGGDVASNGKIYCHGYKPGKGMRCLEKDSILNQEIKPLSFDYLKPDEVQKVIKTKKLIQFGSLEKRANQE